jgi:organic radical activating enzyme
MKLGLILGARCNASCVHCSESHGPYRAESLDRRTVIRLMNEAAAIDDGAPLYFLLTGGEPFLDFDLLVEVVAHGASLGGQVSCVTNAFWARTDELAKEKLSVMRDAGLTALAVSVSRFHQRFVPLHRVRRALEAAGELGIRTELKGAITNSDMKPHGALQQWKSVLDADRINIFPVLPYLRESAALPEDEYYRVRGLPTQACPGEVVTVGFDQVARSCCSPGSADDFLSIGDASAVPLAQINRRLGESGKQRILREHGPIYFANAAIGAGLGSRLRDAYAGPCDLCCHIRSDSELCRIAEAVSSSFDSMRTNSP